TYDQIHDAVTNTFVAMNHAPAHLSMDLDQWKQDIISYRDATDAVMFACYPYPPGPGTCTEYNVLGYPECKMDRLPISADVFRMELNKPGQPIWMIIQAHKSIPLKEARWEAYTSFIHGATGIFWAGWTWDHPQGGGPQNWPVIKQVIQEMAELHPFFIMNEISGIQTNNPNVEARGKRQNNKKCAVVAAARNGFVGPAQIYLPGSGNKKITVAYESRFIYASNGWISDSFNGYQGHVYRYTSSGNEIIGPSDHVSALAPEEFTIQVSPNPSRGQTRTFFTLPQEGAVIFTVYDAAGRKVALAGSGNYTAGKHEIVWNGQNHEGTPVPSGLYFIRGQTTDGKTTTAKVLIQR
ncbi:MAG TPA: T9SS type A sorting domain-containing protein, partial [bacterium]|nr:T9SS type A sorting domain-containing protein [bacterium]